MGKSLRPDLASSNNSSAVERRLSDCAGGGKPFLLINTLELRALLDRGITCSVVTQTTPTLAIAEVTEICTTSIEQSQTNVLRASGIAHPHALNQKYTWTIKDCDMTSTSNCIAEFQGGSRRLGAIQEQRVLGAVIDRATQGGRRMRGAALDETLDGSENLVTKRRLGKFSINEPVGCGQPSQSMIKSGLPPRHRCKGFPSSGWDGLGKGLSAEQCQENCLVDASCKFAVFRPDTGGCSSFATCSSWKHVSWSPVVSSKHVSSPFTVSVSPGQMVDAGVPAGKRCAGDPVGGWDDLGVGVTAQQCQRACHHSPPCMFAVFRHDSGDVGRCSSFASCSPEKSVEWTVTVWKKR